MNEMEERVARVVDPSAFSECWNEKTAAKLQERARLTARAAIAAMREPTKAMTAAAPYPTLYNSQGAGIDPPPHICWQRMIDAALGEKFCALTPGNYVNLAEFLDKTG